MARATRDLSKKSAILNDLAPYTKGVAVTPSDGTNLTYETRALYIGGAGAVSVIFADDSTDTAVVLAAVPAGTMLYIAVKRVRATGTAATNIVALR